MQTMTKINLDSFSAVKYKNELYQIRLSSYLSKCEDFEEIDFIKEEMKFFDDCFNAVDFSTYCQNMEDYNYIKDEIGEFAVSGMYPIQNQEVLDYINNNASEEKRLQKTFSLIRLFLSEKENVNVNDKSIQTEHTISEVSQQPQDVYIPKPCFEPDSIESIIQDLKTFFDISQHSELKRIIETGSNTNEKLLFRDNGNRLTDYFKRLIENDEITGCTKKDLINWIVKNFKYTYRNTQKDFIPKTVEKTISGTEQPCKNPIM